MGRLKQWSEIFDLLENGELFSAKIYEEKFGEDNKRKYGEKYEKTGKTAKAEEERHCGVKRVKSPKEKFYELYFAAEGTVFEVGKEEAFEEKTEEYFEREAKQREAFKDGEKVRTEYESIYAFSDFKLYDEKEKARLSSGQYESISQREGLKKLFGTSRDRILDDVREEYRSEIEKVKIEVTNHNTIEKETDIDDISYRLTQKLCEMMTRGADGVY